MSIDAWITKVISNFVQVENEWLKNSLCKVKIISDYRKSTAGIKSPAYGFEWLIQTGLSHSLIQNTAVSNLKIGQKHDNNKKYDFSFTVQQQKIIIELKTICGNISYAKSDVSKQFPCDFIPYFLIFNYPQNSNSRNNLALKGTSCVDSGYAPENFLYYIYKKI